MTAPKGKGAAYAPRPAPLMVTPETLREWAVGEFGRIADTLQNGRVPFLRLDVLTELPAKPVEGMICFFAAGVAGVGGGTYEFVNSAWSKL